MARAYFKWGKLRQCKNVLLRARRVAPHDTVLLYNSALVLQKLASSVLEDTKSSLRTVLSAVHELGLAHKYFGFLKKNGDKNKFDLQLAEAEERQCQDLLSQAQYHVVRARRMDEEEQEIRRKQEEEREALRQKMLEQQRTKDEERLKLEQELIQKRQQFVEQSKSKLFIPDVSEDKPRKSKKRYQDDDGFVTDGSSDGENKDRIRRPLNEGEGGPERKSKKRRRVARSGSDEEERKERRDERKKKRRHDRHEHKDKAKVKGKENKVHVYQQEDKSSKQKGKFKSKEYIDSSGSSSSDEEMPREPKLVINDDESDNEDAVEKSDNNEKSSQDSSDSDSNANKTKRTRIASDSEVERSPAASHKMSDEEQENKCLQQEVNSNRKVISKTEITLSFIA